MAYDAAASNVVLFGGQDSGVGPDNVLGDTWVWNGSTWTEEFPAVSPPARDGATMTYDAATGNVVLFGGLPGTSYMCETCMNDTWAWNGSTWTELNLTNSPPARFAATMAYDAATQNVVLFGGEGDLTVGLLNDTWTLGTAYVCPAGVATPSPCSQSATIAFSVDAGTTIGSVNVLTEGAANLDFTLNSGTTTCAAETYSSATTCTVGVTFAPKYPGARSGAVVIENGSDVLATVYVYGTGTAPEVAFNPGAASALGGGFSEPEGAAVDGAGNIYVADWGNSAVKEMPPGCTASNYNNGTCTITALGGGFNVPYGVVVDGSGNVYVADSGNDAVKEINRATPPSLSFAETSVGTESSDSPQTATLDNIGNAALTFPVPSSGNNPSISTGFQLDSSTTCPQVSASSSAGTLAASASCALAVDFVPTAPGPITGSLVLTDNNLNAAAPGYATQTIGLSGTGKGAQITLAPTSLPAATYGTSYSSTITASGGTAPYTYAISTGSLPAGLTLSAPGTISGVPTVTGIFGFTIKATDSQSFTGTQNYILSINTATLTITANNSTKVYGTVNPAFTGTVTGVENGDSFTESFTTTATVSSPVGSYAIVPSVTGADLADYTQSVTDGTLTVTQAASSQLPFK